MMYEHLLCIGKRFDGEKLLQYWSALDAQGQPIGNSFAFAAPIQNAHTGEVWRFLKNPEGAGWALFGDADERPLFAHHHSNRQLVNLLFLDEQKAITDLTVKIAQAAAKVSVESVVKGIRENLETWVAGLGGNPG